MTASRVRWSRERCLEEPGSPFAKQITTGPDAVGQTTTPIWDPGPSSLFLFFLDLFGTHSLQRSFAATGKSRNCARFWLHVSGQSRYISRLGHVFPVFYAFFLARLCDGGIGRRRRETNTSLLDQLSPTTRLPTSQGQTRTVKLPNANHRPSKMRSPAFSSFSILFTSAVRPHTFDLP